MNEPTQPGSQFQAIELRLDDPNPVIERFAIYPYPDLTKLWVRALLSPFAKYPNVQITVFGPDGEDVGEVFMVEQREQNVSFTLHLREPYPGERYAAQAILSYRTQPDISENSEETILDQKRIEFDLVFVDPGQNT